MNECTVMNGTLAWDVSGNRDCSQCLDIDPDMLYELDNVREKLHKIIAVMIGGNYFVNRKIGIARAL